MKISFPKNSILSKVFYGASYNAFASIIQSLISFVGGIVISRSLGPIGRGELSALFLWMQIVTWISTFGITRSTIFYLSKLSDYVNIRTRIKNNAVLFSIFVGSVSGILFSIYIGWPKPILDKYILFFLIFILLISEVLNSILLALKLYRLYSIKKISESLFIFISTLFLFYSTIITVKNYLIFYLLSSIFSIILILLMSNNLGVFTKISFFKFDYRLFKMVISYGLKSYFSDLIKMLVSLGPNLYILPFLGAAAYGNYVVANSIASIPLLAFQAISAVMVSELSGRLSFISLKKSIAFRKKYLFGIIFVYFIFIGIAWQIMPYCINLFFSGKFVEAISISQILLIWTFFSGFSLILSNIFYSLGYPNIVLKINIFSSIVIGFLVMFTRFYGLLGLSLSILIASIVELFTYLFYVIKYLKKENITNAC